jgi:hypothetical protein
MTLRALNWLGSNWLWYRARNSDSKQVMTRARVFAGVDRVRVGDGDVGDDAGTDVDVDFDADVDADVDADADVI